MSDFQVQISELKTACDAFSTLKGQSTQQQSLLSTVNIGSNDFGCLQGILTLFNAFQENLGQSNQALADITSSLEAIEKGLNFTLSLYELFESSTQQAIEKFFGGIG
ncbi:hypothetical protein [Tessaracoccus sp. OH4464_COT-324]|uniref:hypothetical protein n=1 Tax=Tessaracoccus sp. OH4464_COT-324 TaxID=2491059 RepID=UPI000F640100|nr:hypothetical protein [Tessaracoccus sp. OH4464_COT-324]RRD46816.1 hypothetical protein EII42_05115 [Tessaracoccus sp. OH4464_COT-324]